MIFSNKRGQGSLAAFGLFVFLILGFVAFMGIYVDFKDYLFTTISSPLIRIIITLTPVFYWVGGGFAIGSVLRSGG